MLQVICSHSSANFADIDKSTFLHLVVDIYDVSYTPPIFKLITDWMETFEIGRQMEDTMRFICNMCDIKDVNNDCEEAEEMLDMHMKDVHNQERCQLCRRHVMVSILTTTTHNIYRHSKLFTSFLMTTICNNTICSI